MASVDRGFGDKYVLPTGREDAARLDLIDAVYGPISVCGLEAAGLAAVRRAADIGCGTGTVSRWLAKRLGRDAHIDAIDISEDQLVIARETAPSADSGAIAYRVASAYEPDLPEAQYDLVFVRLVLCHLKEPDKAVAAITRLLKPGGRAVIVDMDMFSVMAMPRSEHYCRWLEKARIHQRNIGVDYAIGTRLHELLSGAGLETTFLAVDQPVYNEGAGKHLWENTWRNALPHVVNAGSITKAEGDELIAGMAAHNARPDVWIGAAKMFVAVGTKGGP